MTGTTQVRGGRTAATGRAYTTVFAERSLRLRADVAPDGTADERRSAVRGMSVEHADGHGWTEHRFADDDALLRAGRTGAVGAAADTLREVQERPLYALSEESRTGLAAVAAETGAHLSLGVVQQHVAAGGPDRVRAAERMVTTLEVRLTGTDGTRHTRSLLCGSPADTKALRDVAARTAEQIRRRLALPLADTLPDRADLVLLPGLAGAFFHEIVGHPMEGDVVASGTSYLGARAGRRVAPDWLSVVDGGREAVRGYRSPFDDEGTDCSTARLIDRGTVGRPMTDLAVAGLLDTPGTGHGRRQDYRHPAIPRMTHTVALVEPGTPLQAPPGDWIAPYGLRLHMMNIASGEFVFDAPFSLLHRADGGLARLGPLEVTGNGARVLAGIEPFEHRVDGYLRATGGCGKLGQYPVLVSFANAGLRVPSGLVGLRAVARA
ncbi:metallopeptidase TldD-related protein [Streptomyces sp. NBC_01314]|uniref:metallopeptidase TldD-related protein n=1 Tax=Streptomyces sp. NBC_01314 TaxID=2903821 RepID=UPI0030927DCC|nr:metallopeptidase TldD-related protein [Streptomyces sp. NBC_01314]